MKDMMMARSPAWVEKKAEREKVAAEREKVAVETGKVAVEAKEVVEKANPHSLRSHCLGCCQGDCISFHSVLVSTCRHFVQFLTAVQNL